MQQFANNQGSNLPARTILRRPAVEERTGLSRSSIYQMIKEGRFPKSVRLGAQAVGWYSDEIDSWIAGRPRIIS